MMSNQLPYLAGAQDEQRETPTVPDWREILVIVVERIWAGVTVAVLVFLYFWIGAIRQTPYYRSTATLIVEAQVPQILNFQDAMSFGTRNLEYFNTHLKALHSRQIMEHALHDSGLANDPSFMPGITNLSRMAELTLRHVTISPVERSRMLTIAVEHPSREVAAVLANALARSYIHQDLDNRMRASMQAVEWLRARADDYRENLERGLLELQQYREATQSVSLEADQNIVIEKLKALNSALTQAQTQRIEVETQWQSVQLHLHDGGLPDEVASLLDDRDVQDAHRRWREQQRKLDAIGQRYLPGHPDHQAAMEEQRNLRTYFEQTRDHAVEALRSRNALLREREQGLQAALREQEQAAFDLDRKLVHYNDLRRYVEAEQSVYQAVIGRMKEASLSGSLPAELIRLVEEARPAGAPFRPNRRRAMLRGAGLGFGLGFMAIFGLYYADHRLRRTEEIERQLGLHVLGTLPLIEGDSLRERGLIMHLQDAGEAAEAFRSLRAGLTIMPGGRDQKCLMVTSSSAGEGKTLVATNLAVCYAQDGHRTLLMGTDLRRPSIHRLFESDAGTRTGLMEVLRDGLPWRDALLPNEVSGLDVLPSGGTTSRPAELLGSKRFTDLLAKLMEQYDRIILDAPPLLGLSDTLTMLPRVDRVLFVVRFGVTHSASARLAVKRIRMSGATCAGAIMNGVNLKALANYYYYSRYGGYAYRDDGSGRAEHGHAPVVPWKRFDARWQRLRDRLSRLGAQRHGRT